MKQISIFILLISVFSNFNLKAQSDHKLSSHTYNHQQKCDWYGIFDVQNQPTEAQFWEWYQKIYELNSNITYQIYFNETDEIGMQHKKYQQYYHGILVRNGVMFLHMINGKVESFNGEIYNINNSKPKIENEALVLEKTLKAYGSKIYSWQMPNAEAFIKTIKNDTHATYYPKGELQWVQNLKNTEKGFELCYRFDITSYEPFKQEAVFSNAENAHIFYTENTLIHYDSTCRARTYFRGNKTIKTDYIGSGNFKLREKNRPIVVYKTSRTANLVFTNTGNYWKDTTEKIATDVHWANEMVYDFLKTNFNWNSYNNKGDSIISVLNLTSTGNAFWDLTNNFATFLANPNSTTKPCAAIDVVGHETGHGVADENAKLVYTGEASGLHESFADIQGALVERYADSTKSNWLIGEEIWVSSGGIRNMSNPKAFSNPNCYKGQFWGGGSHSMGGVQNFWFFITSMGDTGTNDLGYSYAFKGIGRKNTYKIHYRNYFYYMTPNGTFPDAAKFDVKSAKDLFGPCSQEIYITHTSWKACGINDTSNSILSTQHGFDVPNLTCAPSLPYKIKMTNKGDAFASYLWKVNGVDSSTIMHPSFSLNYGTHKIHLTTNLCGKKYLDSTIISVSISPKIDFIRTTIDSQCFNSNYYEFNNITTQAYPQQKLSYLWQYIYDTQSDTNKHLKINFSQKGTFEVKLQAKDQFGCIANTKQLVNIFDNPILDFKLASVCPKKNVPIVNLTSKPSEVNITYTWRFSDADTKLGFEPIKQFLQNGLYTITLITQSDKGNGCKDSLSKQIYIKYEPKADFIFDTVCSGETITFKDISPNRDSIKYNEWDLEKYMPFDKTTVEFPEVEKGIHQFSLKVYAKSGCFNIITKQVNIEEGFDIKLTSQKTCDGSSFLFNISTTPNRTNLKYNWNYDNKTYVVDNPSIIANKQSGSVLKLTLIDDKKCKSSVEILPIILNKPILDLQISDHCEGNDLKINDLTIDLDSLTYKWFFGDGNTSTLQKPKHSYNISKTTTFNMTTIVTDKNLCKDSLTMPVTVFEKPRTCLMNWENTNGNIRNVKFKPSDGTNHSAQNDVNYKWWFDNNDSSSISEPSFTFKDYKCYQITMKATTENTNCICEIKNDLCLINASTNTIIKENIILYPNPSQNTLYISSNQFDVKYFEIINNQGQVLMQDRFFNTSIDISKLEKGLYIIRLKNNQSEIVNLTFIKN